MEPDIMPMYSSSPPPLDYDGEAEEDEFGDFGGFSVLSCSTLTDYNEQPCSLRQSSPTIEPDTSPPSFKQPVEQAQPTSTVKSGCSRGQVDEEGQHCNGYTVRDHPSGTHAASLPGEETGFADFSVFTDQAAHPWCCGFAPVGTESWDGRDGDKDPPNSLGEQLCDSGQEVIMNSEPRSHCVCKAKEDICTKVKHCEIRDTSLVQPSQDHHQPQEPAAVLDFPSEETRPGEEEIDKPVESQRETRCSPSPNFYSLQTSESEEERKSVGDGADRENSISPPSHTASLYESAAEDLTLFCDVLTPDSPSADFELSVPCFDFQEDEPDWEHQADEEEEEELENFKHADSMVNQDVGDLQSQSATQETSATSNQSESATHAGDGFADSKDGSFDHENDGELPQTLDAVEPCPGLPPSDSFADFCSASTQGDGEGSWVEFREQRTPVEEKPWTQFRAQDSNQQTEGDTEEECGVSEGSRCQASLCCRVQQLLHISFPDVLVPAAGCEEEEEGEEEEEEVFGLGALLRAQHLPDYGKDEMRETCSRAQGVQRGMWWQHEDVHSAVGLQFQWGGSYANRTLLRCLGVDTKNIVFVGMKKQPLVVPAFASSLGMLEPSKDSVRAVCSPGHTTVTAQTPAWPQDRLGPSTDSVQEPLPSSQLDCSSSGLSSSQDGVRNQASIVTPQQPSPTASPLASTGCPALNLDYFGPVEESASSSSSSRSHSPPPGVDRELYELTISKLETSVGSSHGEDTLNWLMSIAEKTSTSVSRAHQQDEELSSEASMVISILPDLSFMMAKVLMFPSTLTSKECRIPTLE